VKATGTAASTASSRCRRRRRGAGILAAFALCIAASVTVGTPSSAVNSLAAGASALPAVPRSPVVDSQAFRGQGRLAFLWSDGLYVLDGRAGWFRQVAPSGTAAAPAWSADGRWFAYLRRAHPGEAAGELWIFDVSTAQSRRIAQVSPNLPSGGFVWSPTASILAVLTRHASGVSQLSLVSPTGDVQRLPNVDEAISSFDWSPDGRMLAYVMTNQAPSPHDVVKTITATARPSVSRFEAPPVTGVQLAGWWPNGKGMLFWLVRSYSRSLAADGSPLLSLGLDGSNPRRLVTTLLYRDWLSWGRGGQLLAVEGSGREVWKEKFLTECDVAAGTCHRLPQRPGTVALDPAWTAQDHAIAFVRAKALSGLPSADAQVPAWMDTRTLWLAGPDGSNAREVVWAGRGVVGPMWSTNGRDLLFWRDASLWLLNTKTDAVRRVVGPFPARPTLTSFYGHVSWRDLISWHRP
jgi:Tol biopolymer transport system component